MGVMGDMGCPEREWEEGLMLLARKAVLARAVIKKGRNFVMRLGGEEIEYNSNFRLYLQTKLSNPHYKPEIAAQCTLVNFIATEKGLEDQLLAKVVGAERPDLEETQQELNSAFQSFLELQYAVFVSHTDEVIPMDKRSELQLLMPIKTRIIRSSLEPPTQHFFGYFILPIRGSISCSIQAHPQQTHHILSPIFIC